jgi:hypothetical protein
MCFALVWVLRDLAVSLKTPSPIEAREVVYQSGLLASATLETGAVSNLDSPAGDPSDRPTCSRFPWRREGNPNRQGRSKKISSS